MELEMHIEIKAAESRRLTNDQQSIQTGETHEYVFSTDRAR